MSKLNPQIKTVEVGTKSLREVTIYPLSMSDQFKLTDILVEVFKEFSTFDELDLSDTQVVEKGVGLIKDNLEVILKIVTEDSETITFDELTNTQFSELAVMLYEVNYETMLGNLKSLVKRVKGVIKQPLTRQSPISSDTSQVSD